MSPTIRLGARLAWGTPGQRGRSQLVVVAAAVGAFVLLSVLAIAAAERAKGSASFSDSDLARLSLAVVAAVALPLVILAATVGRLSASIRDRRLANLRLLGLSPSQTRLVAATEAGVGAGFGAAIGAAAYLLFEPVLAATEVAGRSWTAETLSPGLMGWFLALAGIPVVTVAVATLPHRYDARSTLDRARRRDAKRPSLLRWLPMLAGLVLCVTAWGTHDDGNISNQEVAILFAGVGLTGLGIVLVVPVFVRLLADLLHRLSRRPSTLIAARRLQAQPAGVTRVVSGLMVGLFLVIGARCVVVAFESTPQYESAAHGIEVEQAVSVSANAQNVEERVTRLESVAGVRRAVVFATLRGDFLGMDKKNRWGFTALVGTCADLEQLAPAVTGCSDTEPMWVHQSWPEDRPESIRLRSTGRGHDSLVLPTPARQSWDTQPDEFDRVTNAVYFDLFVPEGVPGVLPISKTSGRQITVLGDPGRDLYDRLEMAGFRVTNGWPDVETYDFVGGLRAIVWSVASVILGVGLLTFAIAAIDRALTRRRELASLQVLGTQPGVLRRAQWLEAALPTTVGCLLAIAAGFFAGSTYLQLDSSPLDESPWRQAGWLSVLAVGASVLIAGLTVLATNTRLTPDVLRAE